MIRRSSAKKEARPLLIGALALLIPAAIAGCEAGFDAPTLEYHRRQAARTSSSTESRSATFSCSARRWFRAAARLVRQRLPVPVQRWFE